MAKDLWLIDYHRAFDDYIEHAQRYGEDEAKERLRANLKASGLDHDEIEIHVASVTE